MSGPEYAHTQRAAIHWIVGGLAVGIFALGAVVPGAGPYRFLFFGCGVVLLGLAACFARLTIRATDDALLLRFGPLPLFGKRIPYREIRSFRIARSKWVDGWGIHWIPGRGWTWNLWGFDCIELELEHGSLRVGTDDPQGLAEQLARRVGDRAS